MRRFPAVLLGTAVLVLLAVLLACGGSDPQPQIGKGPADDIDGAWSGTYMAADGSQHGTFCVDFKQDERGLTGEVSFNGGEPSAIGGVITEKTFLFTWGSGLEQSPAAAPPDITIGGGTMNGTTGEDAISGTWIAAATADVHGDWTATRLGQSEDCTP